MSMIAGYSSLVTILVGVCCLGYILCDSATCCDKREALEAWQATPWRILPSTTSAWDFEQPALIEKQQGIPPNVRRLGMLEGNDEDGDDDNDVEGRGKLKVGKKYRKFLIPLLLAYKLKFFTLIPVLIGGLILLTGATGLAGFFFALFAAVMGLKSGDSDH